MRQFLFISALLTIIGCSSQPIQNIIAVKIDRNDTTKEIQKLKPDQTFTRFFLNYLVKKFPTASKVIFYPHDATDSYIKLSDTAYEFGMISSKNKIFLLNSLPKDLSKEQSNSYFKRLGLFTYTDSSDLAKQDSLFEERIKWTKAPASIESEFLKFYALLRSGNEYLIVVPKDFITNAPW